MPKIIITENDVTRPGTTTELSNVVYVPGFATQLPENFSNMPRLYTTLSDFENDFGSTVPKLKSSSKPTYQEFTESNKNYTLDSGYIYATELLRLGIPVVYDCLVSGNTQLDEIKANALSYTEAIAKVLAAVKYNAADSTRYDMLCDKGLYQIKFLSNGGYVSKDINDALFALAVARTDCVALVDILYTTTITKTLTNFVADCFTVPATETDKPNLKYAAMFAPWCSFKTTSIVKALPNTEGWELPGSFAYLMAMAKATNTGANNWQAYAGANRGKIPNIVKPKQTLSQALIDVLQTRGEKTGETYSINPIATINPFGLIVWGNRTLFDNSAAKGLTASSFLNIRNMCSDIKKRIFIAARQLTFEQNNEILWVNFKSKVTPLLDQMVSSGALSGYELVKKANKKKAELSAIIRLYAIEAVEDFELEVQLADQTSAVIE